jgi:hypothetical protein
MSKKKLGAEDFSPAKVDVPAPPRKQPTWTLAENAALNDLLVAGLQLVSDMLADPDAPRERILTVCDMCLKYAKVRLK